MSVDVISKGTNFNFQFDFLKSTLDFEDKVMQVCKYGYFSKIHHQHKAQTFPSEPCSMSAASGTWEDIRSWEMEGCL